MLVQIKEIKMAINSISKALPDVVLDTCLVPAKKAAAKKTDEFFPGSALIENVEKIAEKNKKADKAENVGNLVGNIINYFG